MMNSKDLLARLLANENLNVIRSNVSTASFETVTRTLTLPQWKDMSMELEEMLIGHEVGHALYTDNPQEHNFPNFRRLHNYMNVIEDVRIEKLIKNRYPGLRKSFLEGYKQLNDKNFFGIQGTDLKSLLLIDRINLYYKCGFNCGVNFTPVEMEFVRRADRCLTMNDVYVLAEEIWEYSKDARKAKREAAETMREQNGEDPPEEEIIEEDDFDIDPNSDFDYEDDENEVELEEKKTERQTTESTPAAADDEQKEEEELESQTQRSFDDRLSELADVNTVVQNFKPKLEIARDPIVGYKTVLKELSASVPRKYERTLSWYGQDQVAKEKAKHAEELTKFKTDSMRVVNYLVKEFEMRKSATEYKRITTSKSGELDVRKLYAHSLTDDIFKKIDVIPEDKNHGMIFLLDWSGSMCDVMKDTLKQVINLAMFCRRIQIPYQVFAFSSSYDHIGYEIRQRAQLGIDPVFAGFNDSNFHLIEFFNNKMSNVEFNKMIELLDLEPYNYAEKYGMHSTPLNESLLYLVDYVGKFIKTNSVEKMSLVTLTDGEGHALDGASCRLRQYRYGGTKTVNYIRDPMTNKEYPLTDNGSDQTRLFLRIIKDRYSVKTVGFHVASTDRRSIEAFVAHNIAETANDSVSNRYYLVEQLRKDMRQNSYAMVHNTGRDELYLLPASKQKIEEGDLKIDSTANAKSIAKEFGKFLGVKKTSRVVLNRFIGVVA
jgi:hypothetical protein